MSDGARDLLVRGIAAAKTGDRAEARHWLEEVLANDPHNPRALRRLALVDGRLQRGDLIDPDQPLPDRKSVV